MKNAKSSPETTRRKAALSQFNRSSLGRIALNLSADDTKKQSPVLFHNGVYEPKEDENIEATLIIERNPIDVNKYYKRSISS